MENFLISLFICLFIMFIGKTSKKAEMYIWTLWLWLNSLFIKLMDGDNLDYQLVKNYLIVSWILYGLGCLTLLFGILIPNWSNNKSSEIIFDGDKNEIQQ